MLAKPITFNKYIQPACLPNSSSEVFPADFSPVYASGWVSRIMKLFILKTIG